MGPIDLIQELSARGLVADRTAELEAHLAEGSRTVYCGFDPTADSLHVGSLLPLLALRRFQLAGHRPIILIGGGTGLIGDPSGKTAERPLNPAEQVAEWAARLTRQVGRFVEFGSTGAGARLLDNHAWLSRLDVISFLRDIGKEFPVGAMLAKESVRARLGRADVGLSYTEFSYQILQAYDFLELWRTEGCTLQIGGTDQWGNITAGIELIRRKTGGAAHGLTLPLVTRTDGSKFGKTEAGTVWLDAARTSPYEFYQFWLNTADADVVSYLGSFTFLPVQELEALAVATGRAPEQRAAQRVLAREATRLVHGPEGLAEAEAITAVLFSGDLAGLSPGELDRAFQGAPRTDVAPAEIEGRALVDLLVRTGLAGSRRAGRELVATGAIQVNGQRVSDPDFQVSRGLALHGRYIALRKGKRTWRLLRLAEAGPPALDAGRDRGQTQRSGAPG